MTLAVSLAGLLVGAALGSLVAWSKLAGRFVVGGIGNAYAAVFRGVPELLVVYFIYFGSSALLTALGNLAGFEGFLGVPAFAAGALAVGIISDSIDKVGGGIEDSQATGDLPATVDVLLDGLGGMLREQARAMRPDDVLVAVSFRNYSPEVIELAADAWRRGISVIVITDSAVSPLARSATIAFDLGDASDQPFRSLVEPLCLAQTLVVSVGHAMAGSGPRVSRTRKRGLSPVSGKR